MSAPQPSEVSLVLAAVNTIPKPWTTWPGGYPSRMDLALVDAVMSIRFRYGQERKDGTWTGARGAVKRYEEYTAHVTGDRVRHLAEQDPVALERVLLRQKVHAGKTKGLCHRRSR